MCKPFWMQWNLDTKTQRFPVCRVRDIALGVIKSEKDKYGRTVFEMAQGVGGRAVVGWGGRTKKSLGTNTRCAGNSFSSTSGGRRNEQGNCQPRRTCGRSLLRWGVEPFGLCANKQKAEQRVLPLVALAWGFTQKYQFARRAVELIGLENQMLDFQMMHA